MAKGSALTRSSRLVEVTQVGSDGLSIVFEADQAERQALAGRNGLERIESLAAHFRLRRESRSGIHVTGMVDAVVVQTCVITLEPFATALSQPVDVHFLPERDIEAMAAGHPAKEPGAEPLDEDLPDPIVNGRIDLRTLAAEHLALALDPYPKKPGAVFSEPGVPEEKVTSSPFAALSRLKSDRAH